MCEHDLGAWAVERQGVGDACEESQDDSYDAENLNGTRLAFSSEEKPQGTYAVRSAELLCVAAESDASTEHNECDGDHRVGG